MLSFVLFICLKLLGLLSLRSWTPNKPTTTKTNHQLETVLPTLPCSHSTVDHHLSTVNTARFNRLSHSFTACRLTGNQPPSSRSSSAGMQERNPAQLLKPPRQPPACGSAKETTRPPCSSFLTAPQINRTRTHAGEHKQNKTKWGNEDDLNRI